MSKFFKAKLQKPAESIDIVGNRIVITPPREIDVPEGKEPEIKPAQINFQVRGMKPVELTDAEWENEKMFLMTVLKRSNEITEIEDTAVQIKSQLK